MSCLTGTSRIPSKVVPGNGGRKTQLPLGDLGSATSYKVGELHMAHEGNKEDLARFLSQQLILQAPSDKIIVAAGG